jgi:Na+-transporting methylmalonyl-CoA/oxaloacetate decarboxylase gamma subunit
MYCPSCGTELVQEMSYCNRCGANLKPVLNQAGVPSTRLVGATWAISVAVAAITLGGFAMVFTLIMALVSRGVRFTEAGMALIFAALMIILAIDWLLIRQLSRVIGKSQSSGDTDEKASKGNLTEKPVAQLGAPRDAPVSSVTENTTRAFEPVYRERDTQR